MKRLLLFLFLLISMRTEVSATITTLTQSDIPYTKFNATNDTFYTSGNIICSTGTAIYLSGTASNCLIDLGGDTIFYSVTNHYNSYGINMYRANDVVIKNGTIYSMARDTLDWVRYNQGISFIGKDVTIRDMNIRVTGLLGQDVVDGYDGSHCVLIGDAQNYAELRNKIINCNLQNAVTYYWRRSAYPASNVFSFLRWPDDAADSAIYTTNKRLVIDSCTLSPVNHAGLSAVGNSTNMGIYRVTNSYFLMSSQVVFDTFCTACDGGFKYGNTYAITLRHAQLLEAWGNTIIQDTGLSNLGVELNGGNGIFFDDVKADSLPDGNFSLIHDNNITASLGPLGGNHSTALTVRELSKAYIYNNIITSLADTLDGTPYRASQANGIWTGFDNHDFSGPVDSVFIFNNKITANGTTPGTDATTFLHREISSDWVLVDSANDLYSTGEFWTFIPTSGTAGILDFGKVYNDTLTKLNSNSSPYTFATTALDAPVEISVYDIYSATPDVDTAISWGSGASSSFFRLGRTINITVNGNNSQPVSGASVVITNAYGQEVFNSTTDESGQVMPVVNYWKEYSDIADSVVFQPLTIMAAYGTDTTETANFLLQGYSGPRDTTLVLTATEGSGAIITPVYRKYNNVYHKGGPF